MLLGLQQTLWALLTASFVLLIQGTHGAPSTVTFANCETLASNKNVYWTLDRAAGVVTYALEDRIPDNSWSAFGFNPPSAKTLNMIPSDVTMTTAAAGGGMAVDYYLKDRIPCSSGGGPSNGVCPDTRLRGSNDVTLISAERVNGVSKVAYSKPLKTTDTTDDFDLSGHVDQPLQAIYASGPLQSGVPQFHDTSLGYVNSGIQLTLGRPAQRNCQPLLPEGTTTSTNSTGTAPAAAPAGSVSSSPSSNVSMTNPAAAVTARTLGLAAAVLAENLTLAQYVTSNFTYFLANTSGPLTLSNATLLQNYVTGNRQRAAAADSNVTATAPVVKEFVLISPFAALLVAQMPALQQFATLLWFYVNGTAGLTWYAENGVFTPAPISLA